MAERTWGDLLDDVHAAIADRDWDRGAAAVAHLRREAEHRGDPRTLASAAFYAGMLYDARGALAEAEAAFGEAVSWDERAWGPKHESVADALRSLAMVQARLGKRDAALASFERAADIHHEAGDVVREAAMLRTAGNALRLAGDLDEAFRLFAEARSLVKDRADLPSRLERAHALLGASECRRQAKSFEEALKLACMATEDGSGADEALQSMLARCWLAIAILFRRAFAIETAAALALEMARTLTHEPDVRAQIEKENGAPQAPVPEAVVAYVDPKGWARVFHREHGALIVRELAGALAGDRVTIVQDAGGWRVRTSTSPRR